MYQKIYFYFQRANKQAKKTQINKNTKKSKETKEEKRIHTENGLKQ